MDAAVRITALVSVIVDFDRRRWITHWRCPLIIAPMPAWSKLPESVIVAAAAVIGFVAFPELHG